MNNLKNIRKSLDWTQDDLAKKLGTTFNSVSHWEKGRRNIPQRFLLRIAEITGHTIEEILGKSVESTKIPLVGYVGAGQVLNCQDIDENVIERIEPQTIGFVPTPGHFLVEVKGDSMEPVAYDGDYLLANERDIKKGNNIDSLINERCLIILKDGSSYFKIIKKSAKKDCYNLLSLNTSKMLDDVIIDCAVFVKSVIHRRQKRT